MPKRSVSADVPSRLPFYSKPYTTQFIFVPFLKNTQRKRIDKHTGLCYYNHEDILKYASRRNSCICSFLNFIRLQAPHPFFLFHIQRSPLSHSTVGAIRLKEQSHYLLGRTIMVSEDRYKLSQEANPIILEALTERIPYLQIAHADENPHYVSQLDLFGNTDLIAGFGSIKTYNMQNKSRSARGGHEDICIECLGYKGRVEDPTRGIEIPISGAFYYEKEKVWLIPNLKTADGLSIYLKSSGQVYNFARYYLDIMFSYPGVWESTMTGAKCMKSSTTQCIYCVYFQVDKFIERYLNCVSYVVKGPDI